MSTKKIQILGTLNSANSSAYIAQDMPPEDTNLLWIDTSENDDGYSTGQNATLSDAEKTLILALFRNAAYVSDNMGDTLEQLETLWGGGGEEPENPDVPEIPDEPDEPVTPTVTLTGISAVYSGGSVPVGTAVSDLTGIVVTAHYSDGTNEAVTGYTLSGEIAAGENTVTVSYGGKTATFTVTGIAQSSGLPRYEHTIVGTGVFTDAGAVTPSSQYDVTDFMDIDPNYSTLSVATYLDTVSDTRISSSCYAQWFNGDTFLSRTGGSPVIAIGDTKCTKPVTHTAPEEATKFRICVQNNCDRFVLYKGTVSASDI